MAEFPAKKELVYSFWALKDSTGVYPFGSTGSISNGAIAAMSRTRGVQVFNFNKPVTAVKTLPADGEVFHSYRSRPSEATTGDMAAIVLDQNLSTLAQGLTQYTEGQHAVNPIAYDCITYPKVCLVLNFRADIYDDTTGIWTTDKWWVEEYLDLDIFAQQAGGSGNPADDPQTWSYSTLFREAGTEFSGVTISNANYGATQLLGRQYSSDNPVIWLSVVGDNSTTDFTIPSAYVPAAEAATAAQTWEAGSELTYGAGAGEFDLSGQTLSFGTALGTGVIASTKLEFQSGC